MSEESIKNLNFIVRNVGSNIKSTKKQYIWEFNLDGQNTKIEFFDSLISNRKKIVVNGKEQYNKEVSSFEHFTYNFVLMGHNFMVSKSTKNKVDLRIDNQSYEYMYNLSKNKYFYNEEEHLNIPTNKYLPEKFINNEKYKINLFKFLRSNKISDNKTENCKFFNYFNNNYDNDNNKRLSKKFFSLKNKKIYSNQKIYNTKHGFFDSKNKIKKYFNFYRDNEVGFNFKWQKPLAIKSMDDDVNTDDEQLSLAKDFINKQIKEGIKKFLKNKFIVRNLNII